MRFGGGKHEFFPVSLAAKAKALRFSAEELEAMSISTENLVFTCVKDRKGKIIPTGSHHGSRAGRRFHNLLIKELKGAKTKAEAKLIIKRLHDKHMRVGKCEQFKECTE